MTNSEKPVLFLDRFSYCMTVPLMRALECVWPFIQLVFKLKFGLLYELNFELVFEFKSCLELKF